MDPAYVGLGANLGDARRTIERALEMMGRVPGVDAVRRSSLYASAPVGPVPGQPPFLNACAELTFADGAAPLPERLLVDLLAIERHLGRDRNKEVPQGPRVIDVDLLAWGGRELDRPGPPALALPHPRLGQRAFALAPLVELAGPDFVIVGPGGGRAGDLLAAALRDPAQRGRKIV